MRRGTSGPFGPCWPTPSISRSTGAVSLAAWSSASLWVSCRFWATRRVNLPVAVLSTWIANPLTYGPIIYGEYMLGSFLMQLPPSDLHLGQPWMELALALAETWRPLWLGAVVTGLTLAGAAYLLSNTGWRLMTQRRLRHREARRRGSQL